MLEWCRGLTKRTAHKDVREAPHEPGQRCGLGSFFESARRGDARRSSMAFVPPEHMIED